MVEGKALLAIKDDLCIRVRNMKTAISNKKDKILHLENTSVNSIIDNVAGMESIKPYILCGGTALAIQIGHRKSEDLDFMMWRRSKNEKPEVDRGAIEKELREKVGDIETLNMLGFDQVEYVVKGVKFSFFVSGLKALPPPPKPAFL